MLKLTKYCIAVLMIVALQSCGIAKHTSNTNTHEHKRDSVVVHDTAYVPVHVVDEERTQAAINAFKAVTDSTIHNYAAMNDSLSMQLLQKDEAMQRLLLQIAKQKYSIPAITKSTQFAKASAGVTNNHLWLELWQMPVDTMLQVINTHTNVTDTTVDTSSETNVIEKQVLPPAWKNPWFWSTILLILAVVAYFVLQIAAKFNIASIFKSACL